MAKTNLAPQKGYSHIETFKVAGVTFNNRQTNLKKVLAAKSKKKEIEIGIEQYNYKGEPAISVAANGLDIGNLHKKDADYVLANQERILGFTDLFIDTFTNEEGKQIYYARVELLVKNKTATDSESQQTTSVPAPTSTPETTAKKKPFYKNWKFWAAVGVGMVVIYIIALLTGHTK